MYKKIIIIAVITLTVGGAAFAIPTQVSYQGRLTDNLGNPQTGIYRMTFKIYNAATSGTTLWTETQDVEVDNGLYAVQLGSETSLSTTIFDGSTRYLGVTVYGDSEMMPRTVLVTVPNAFHASRADTATAVSSDISIDSTGVATFSAYYGDGSGLTNVGSASSVADGSITLAKLSDDLVGTSANQLVQLDSNAKLPAVDGSQLTGLSTASIDDLSVTAAKIASSAVSSLKIEDYAIKNVDIATTAAIGAKKIADGTISDTEFGYLDGVTSALQTQIDTINDGKVNFNVEAQQVTSGTYGLYVTTSNASGCAVRGQAVNNAGTSQTFGGIFVTQNTNGTGVYGIASGSTGNVKGVHGKTNSTGGRAVHAEAAATSGTNYGIYAETGSSTGYSGYFTGGRGVLIDGNFEADNAKLNGPMATTVAEKSAAYTLTGSDSVLFVDASSAPVSITLPAASTATTGRVYYIYKIDNDTNRAVAVTSGAGDTVNGGASVSTKVQWACIRVIGRDASSWVASTL